jgi:hypothetical protein
MSIPKVILDVISPSNAAAAGAEDDDEAEDELEFLVSPPHAALKAAVRRSVRKRTV